MRYRALIIGVLFAQIASADATEVLVKARNQTTANWADALSKQFNGTVERQVPGLNAAILQIPTNNVENLVRAARDNPDISVVETGGDYRQLFQMTPTIDFDAVQISQAQREAISRLRERKASASVYITRIRPAGISVELLRGALTVADGFRTEKGMKLNLAPGVNIDANQTEIDQRGPSYFVWYGKVENREAVPSKRDGVATFVVQDGKISGAVAIGSDVYTVDPLGNGLHAIVKTNPSEYPPAHPPGAIPKIHDAPEIPLQKRGLIQDQSVPLIRALVVFTPAVRKVLEQSGSAPDALATLAIESVNLASKIVT